MINKEVLRQIKLVVSDLDGTLLNDEGNLDKYTIELIHEINKYNVHFALATGRLFNAIKDYIEILNLKIPQITLDGTYIVNPFSNEVLFEEYLPHKYVKRALNLSDKYLLKVALCHGSAILYTKENSTILEMLEKYNATYTLVDSYEDYIDQTLEILITSEYSEQLRYVSKKMSFPYVYGIRNSFYKSQTHGGIYYLEIRKIGSSKGEGLKKLCEHLNIKVKEAAVIGDWYNDKTLFETDALKVAMANAVPEIKRLSDIVTRKDNNHGGAAEFMEILLSAKK
jgi:Cof subfamily protein (haloacid dehalogenase superfamily)